MTLPKITKSMHILSSGGVKIGVILPELYGKVGNALGIDPTPSGDPDIVQTVRQLLRSGNAIKIRIRYPSGNKAKTADLICSIDNAKTATGKLINLTYRDGAIRSAYFPSRRRLH